MYAGDTLLFDSQVVVVHLHPTVVLEILWFESGPYVDVSDDLRSDVRRVSSHICCKHDILAASVS